MTLNSIMYPRSKFEVNIILFTPQKLIKYIKKIYIYYLQFILFSELRKPTKPKPRQTRSSEPD